MIRKKRLLLSAGAVAACLGAVAAVLAVTSGPGSAISRGQVLLAKQGDPDASRKDLAGIANEGPDGTYAAEQEAIRAYPADSVPFSATLKSISTFKSFKKKAKGPGSWESIGPSQAKYPAVLDQFLAGGKPYVASGRVTALALGGCKKGNKCTLYAGAAGGGVWVADKAFEGGDAHWQFKSGSFGTNAIGALLVDPSDASGKTVYAGTGEANASGDSEAGLGIWKSTNGGNSWTLVPGSDAFQGRSISQLALDNAGNLLVGIARGVRGVSSVTGGATSNPPPPVAALGLYRQTGGTFALIWNGAGSIRGVNAVAVDPNTSTVLYSAAFQQGVYRSLDNGGTWAQIKAPLNGGLNTDRAEFAVNKLPGGFTRMYVGVGNQSDAGVNRARFYRTDDAAGAAVFTDMTTDQNIGWCTAQCWYDNVVVSPAGSPDVVYLGGSFSYSQVHGQSNGRALLLSSDGGATWSDMTIDEGDDGWLHPDQHALVTAPDDPLQFIAGDDGGVVRSDGKFVDASGDCAGRGLDPTDTALCESLLSRIPHQTAVLNKGLVTLQFQSLSADPKHPDKSLMGGTQDNGTFEYSGGAEWPQIIYGDGGQSGWNAADSKLRFNTFFGQASDVNFRDGDPRYWVIATGPIVSSPEGSNFYPPVTADPNPAAAGSIFQGSQSVWRTQDWGGNQAFLEANCPEFTTSAADPACGDFVRIGPAGATDLTAAGYGDRAGAFVAAIERAPGNTGTMWVATGTGRVFITDNANDPAASVVWTRLDGSSATDPQRFVSSIYVDPANPDHAWLSYSGYSFNTPSEPGHVFEVTRSGGTATWVDRTYDLADLPVTDLVRDNPTGDLYAATDFGVMKLVNGGTSWVLAGTGLPMVEVAGLTIVPGKRALFAATHGMSAWELDLPKLP